MQCPRCGSNNVNVQMITETQLKDAHHSCLWWIFIGWWWEAILWIFLTFPKLIFTIFGHKKQRLEQRHVKMCVCQDCGHSWQVK